MHTDYLLLGLDSADFVWNFLSGIVCFVYGIFIFCFLIGIMGNTKRTNELLAQLISFQQGSPEPKSTGSLPPSLSAPIPTALPPKKPVSKPIPTPVSASIDPQSPASKPIPPSTEPFRPW